MSSTLGRQAPSRTLRRAAAALCVCALQLLAPGEAAWAQDANAIALVGSNALRELTGVALVNQSAGDGNLQFNGAAVSVNDLGAAAALLVAIQHSDPTDLDLENLDLKAAAQISGNAFAEARGLVSVSQASGLNNKQVNLVSMSLGLPGELVAEAELAQTTAEGAPPADLEIEGSRSTVVGSNAFREAAGIIQVNQAAGVSNRTFNKIGLTAAVSSP